jgi:hypothetical protein
VSGCMGVGVCVCVRVWYVGTCGCVCECVCGQVCG